MGAIPEFLNGPKMLKEAFGDRVGMLLWRAVLLAAVLTAISFAGVETGEFRHILFGDSQAQSSQPANHLTVTSAAECPPGYSIFVDSDIGGATSVGMNIPEGARVCLVRTAVHSDLGPSVIVRDPPPIIMNSPCSRWCASAPEVVDGCCMSSSDMQ